MGSINLAEKKNDSYKLVIINPKENKEKCFYDNVKIDYSNLSGFGFQGLILDFVKLLKYSLSTDAFLLLGAKSAPLAIVLKTIFQKKLIINVGGIEWKRPEYNFLIRSYLKLCFYLSVWFADNVVFDNASYLSLISSKKGRKKKNIKIIAYGAVIDNSLNKSNFLLKYPFLSEDYFLSISRSISDNKIKELCNIFKDNNDHKLVLISNLSKTAYGKEVQELFSDLKNIVIIDGLYKKDELDLIRLNCKAYIHTHTLCGSAPSLIEMIVAKKPIISINKKQNYLTLKGECHFFDSFNELPNLLNLTQFQEPSQNLTNLYNWEDIIKEYEETLIN